MRALTTLARSTDLQNGGFMFERCMNPGCASTAEGMTGMSEHTAPRGLRVGRRMCLRLSSKELLPEGQR